MIKDFAKNIRWNYNYSRLNKLLNIITDKGSDELLSPKVVNKIPFNKVLILAPHPDDDVLGCGGAIVKHKEADDSVSILCLSDGCRGNLNCSKDESLIPIRREEMKIAHKFLNVDDTYYFDYEDGKIGQDKSIINDVSEIIRKLTPEAIYTPFCADYHKDHVETSKILSKAIDETKFNGKCIAYEVNSPLFPNTILNITDCIEKKIKAVKKYKSQLKLNNYIHTVIEGLNKFRTNGVMLGKGYAEAFFICDAGFYKQILEIYTDE